MDMKTKALTQALEALKFAYNDCDDECVRDMKIYPAIGECEKALKQPEQPPMPVQPEQGCTRSHLHEEMSKECELRTEIARLTNCLAIANAQAEHFEREWYLRGDEIERLKAQPEQEPLVWSEEQMKMLNFLYGSDDFNGLWFEATPPKGKGACWWRTDLRRLFATPPQPKPQPLTPAQRVNIADACAELDFDDDHSEDSLKMVSSPADAGRGKS